MAPQGSLKVKKQHRGMGTNVDFSVHSSGNESFEEFEVLESAITSSNQL